MTLNSKHALHATHSAVGAGRLHKMRSLIKVYTVRHQDHIEISLIIGLQTIFIPTQAKIRKLKINKRKKYFVIYPRNQDLAFEISFLLSNFLVMYKRKFEVDAKPYFPGNIHNIQISQKEMCHTM